MIMEISGRKECIILKEDCSACGGTTEDWIKIEWSYHCLRGAVSMCGGMNMFSWMAQRLISIRWQKPKSQT